MKSIKGALGTSGLAVAMLAGMGGADAEAAEPGTPIQLAAPNACLANLAIGGCSPFKTFNRPLNIDVAPDGADVYMANQSGTIGRFRRDPSTNALTGADFVNFGGGDLSDVFVASSTLLVGAGGSTSGDGMVESFSRDPSTGALRAPDARKRVAAFTARTPKVSGAPMRSPFLPPVPGSTSRRNTGGRTVRTGVDTGRLDRRADSGRVAGQLQTARMHRRDQSGERSLQRSVERRTGPPRALVRRRLPRRP